eukprot:g2571.t1
MMILSTLLILILLYSKASNAVNIIVNGDFEQGLTNGWHQLGETVEPHHDVTTEQPQKDDDNNSLLSPLISLDESIYSSGSTSLKLRNSLSDQHPSRGVTGVSQLVSLSSLLPITEFYKTEFELTLAVDVRAKSVGPQPTSIGGIVIEASQPKTTVPNSNKNIDEVSQKSSYFHQKLSPLQTTIPPPAPAPTFSLSLSSPTPSPPAWERKNLTVKLPSSFFKTMDNNGDGSKSDVSVLVYFALTQPHALMHIDNVSLTLTEVGHPSHNNDNNMNSLPENGENGDTGINLNSDSSPGLNGDLSSKGGSHAMEDTTSLLHLQPLEKIPEELFLQSSIRSSYQEDIYHLGLPPMKFGTAKPTTGTHEHAISLVIGYQESSNFGPLNLLNLLDEIRKNVWTSAPTSAASDVPQTLLSVTYEVSEVHSKDKLEFEFYGPEYSDLRAVTSLHVVVNSNLDINNPPNITPNLDSQLDIALRYSPSSLCLLYFPSSLESIKDDHGNSMSPTPLFGSLSSSSSTQFRFGPGLPNQVAALWPKLAKVKGLDHLAFVVPGFQFTALSSPPSSQNNNDLKPLLQMPTTRDGIAKAMKSPHYEFESSLTSQKWEPVGSNLLWLKKTKPFEITIGKETRLFGTTKRDRIGGPGLSTDAAVTMKRGKSLYKGPAFVLDRNKLLFDSTFGRGDNFVLSKQRTNVPLFPLTKENTKAFLYYDNIVRNLLWITRMRLQGYRFLTGPA